MTQPPKETWCKKCDGTGKVRGYYDPHTRSAFVEARCPDCDGSGETAESLNWNQSDGERDGVR